MPVFVSIIILLLASIPTVFAQSNHVVLVQHPAAFQSNRPDPNIIHQMIATGLRELTGAPTESAAWLTILSTNDVVGIKISTLSAPLNSTRKPVVDAIIAGLTAAGIPPDNILIWDRDPVLMRRAGFEPGPRVVAAIPDEWDPDLFYHHHLVGRLIWGDLLFGKDAEDINTRSHPPLVLSKTITKIINVPVLQDHDTCGIRGALYNLSLAAWDNTRRFESLGQTGDPGIAELCAQPVIRDKLAITILDALVVGYAGGAGFKPRFSWIHNTLGFSCDPVALDAIGLKWVDEKRAAVNIQPVASLARYLRAAGLLRLGQPDPDQIQIRPITLP